MRKRNFGKSRRAAAFFSLCLVTIVVLSLVVGSMALNTKPVDAIITVTPSPTVVTWTESMTIPPITFTHGPSANPPPFPATPPEVFFFWMWGSIPPGLNLDMNTGVLSGCITPGTPPGSATFWVGCTAVVAVPAGVDWSVPLIPNAGQVNWTIVAFPGCTAMVIDPTPIPVAWEGIPFTMANTVTGGAGPYTWGATGLPAGLTIDPGTGLITGTPGPGTCNTINNVTITVTDTSDCFCPPTTRPLILFVDCWANYLPIFYYTTACDFNIGIGLGLTQGQTNVLVDGSHEATLAGGQSQNLTSVPCESHTVMVDQTVQPSSNIRFSVIGSNIKTVTDVDNYAYFDYAQEVYIQTASDPSGKAQPPGAGFYAIGGNFSSTAPSTIESDIGNGIKYVFWEWQLPDGTTRPNVNLVFNVNQGGTVIAKYKTYYQLTLHSEYPAINESTFEPAGSTATWNLSLHAVPVESGFWAFLGAVQSPLNGSGSQLMTGPSTVEIQWTPNYTMPIVAMVIVLLVIAGLIFLIYRLRGRTRAATETGVKEASSKAKKTADKSFCPKCGNPVDKDADYCKKCGKKLK